MNDSVKATKVTGQIALIGFLTGQATNLDLMQVISRKTKIQGIAVGNRKPVIDTVYPMEDAIQAYEHLDRGAFRNIVIRIFLKDSSKLH